MMLIRLIDFVCLNNICQWWLNLWWLNIHVLLFDNNIFRIFNFFFRLFLLINVGSTNLNLSFFILIMWIKTCSEVYVNIFMRINVFQVILINLRLLLRSLNLFKYAFILAFNRLINRFFSLSLGSSLDCSWLWGLIRWLISFFGHMKSMKSFRSKINDKIFEFKSIKTT